MLLAKLDVVLLFGGAGLAFAFGYFLNALRLRIVLRRARAKENTGSKDEVPREPTEVGQDGACQVE